MRSQRVGWFRKASPESMIDGLTSPCSSRHCAASQNQWSGTWGATSAMTSLAAMNTVGPTIFGATIFGLFRLRHLFPDLPSFGTK
jgi:hypothetical protein